MKTEGAGRTMAHMRLELTEGSRTAAFDLFSQNDRFVITENVFGTPAGSYAEFNLTGVKLNTWQRWSMELDARTSPQMAIVTLDGVEVVRKPFKNPFIKGTMKVTLGALYAPAGPLRHLSYDDVAIEILP